jgi:hypothetical protein
MNTSRILLGLALAGLPAHTPAQADSSWQAGGFISLESHSHSALAQPWPLASGEFGVGWQGPSGLGLDLTMALDDQGVVPATARVTWQTNPVLSLAAGRQDLPFARDRFWFAAPDRPCIHAPQTTEQGLDGGLGAESLVMTLALSSTLQLESWASRAVFAPTGAAGGLRLALGGQNTDLGASLHRENGNTVLAAADGRWGRSSGEWLTRFENGRLVGRGWHLDHPWPLARTRVGESELLVGLEAWQGSGQARLQVLRLALSHGFSAGPIARFEQRLSRCSGDTKGEQHLQLVLPL